MEYIIRVRGGNVFGESNPIEIINKTEPIVPSGSPKSISFDQSLNQIMWEEIDCTKRNGRINEYIVMISNKNITYTVTSTEKYTIVNDLVLLGGTYNISIAGVNTAGTGPFSDIIDIIIPIKPDIISNECLSTGLTSAFITLLIIFLAFSAAIVVPLILYIIKLKKLMAIYSQKKSADDDIVMKRCEPYGVHQYTSHVNDTYEDCQPSATENAVYDIVQ